MEERIENIIIKTFKRDKVRKNPSCYFYDLNDISGKINSLKKNVPANLSVYYAMKANPNDQIMEFISKQAFIKGVEIASVGEMRKALKFYDGNRIIFTGPGKTIFELTKSIENKLKLLNVESLVEIQRINKIVMESDVSKVDILLRINTDYLVDGPSERMAGYSTKMGIDEKDAVNVIQYLKGLNSVNVKGIHAFSASGVLDYQNLIQYDKYVFELVKDLESRTGVKIEIIDLGGGIGIDYTPDRKQFNIAAYFRELKETIDDYDYESKEIIMELGRYIVGECGYFASEIIDIKEIKGRKHIILAGGINHMGLSHDLGKNIPTHIIKRTIPPILNEQLMVENEIVDINGPLCDNKDKLCRRQKIDKAEIGDIVVFSQAGAYGYTLSFLEFLSHDYPFEFIIS
jgi:diaminopimelate decarboxylase